MDVNILRSIITVLCLLAYVGIVFWAYNARQKAHFDQAANLPFADDDMQHNTVSAQQQKETVQEQAHG